jgi:hypothetical protein
VEESMMCGAVMGGELGGEGKKEKEMYLIRTE